MDKLSEETPLSEQGLIDKQALLQKLDAIPAETLRSILTNQVDLEIRLKHKELRLSEDELGKCEAQMLALRQFFDVPSSISFEHEPSDFTLRYYDVLNKQLSVNYTRLQKEQYVHEHPTFKETMFDAEPVHSYRTRSTTLSLRPSLGPAVRIAGCLYRRTDGVVVKLTCPDCHRSNFSSAQGFLNHSRIAHSKEYTSQDAAALRCGEILPDEFQDDEGRASVAQLTARGVDPAKNLNVTEMYFNGLSKSLNTVHRGEEGERDEREGKEKKEKSRIKSEGGDGGDELMKKLIRSGVAHDAKEYEALVGEYRAEVPNLHLFNDEEDDEGATPEATKKRVHLRKASVARAGVGKGSDRSGGPIAETGAGSTTAGGDSTGETGRTVAGDVIGQNGSSKAANAVSGRSGSAPGSGLAVRTRAGEGKTVKGRTVETSGRTVETSGRTVETSGGTVEAPVRVKPEPRTATKVVSEAETHAKDPSPSLRPDVGGKYENRLRRRRSRVGPEIPKLHIDDDLKRTKRRKSQR